MATFSLAELVLNDHLTNSSNYNSTTMTNSSLTSLSSVKVAGHKRKRSSIPDILSTTAGRAKKFLKKFSTSFVTSSDDGSFSPNKIVPNNGMSPLGEHGKNNVRLSQANEKISIKEKSGLKQIETYDALGSGAFLPSRSPKAVCFDSVSSTKWSRLEISMSPKKCEQTSSEGLLPLQCGDIHECLSHRDVVSSSHIHASRMLRWDQVSKDDTIKKVLPSWSGSVGSDQTVGEQRMPYLNGTQVTASEHDLCMSLRNVGANNQPSKFAPKTRNVNNKHLLRHHLQNGSCLTVKNYEPSSVKYKHILKNATHPLIKDVYTESTVLKALLEDTGFFSENIGAISETMLDPTERASKTAQEKGKEDIEVESDDTRVTDRSMLNKGPHSVRMKSSKSLLFLPFPNVPFKIKAIQPTNVRFEVSYTESSMIPTVKTAGEVFEAKLQEVTIDIAGREGFRNSPSEFCCTITVETSDPASKFEEIKRSLRVVCDAYNISVQGTVPEISSKRIRDGHNEGATMIKYSSYNTAVSGSTCTADISEVLTEQHNLQASSVDCDSAPSYTADTGSFVGSNNQVSLSEETMPNKKEGGTTTVESSNSQEAVRLVRRSHRKIKMAGLWKERNAYATRVTRPTSPHPMQDKSNLVNCPFNFIDDQKYLDRTMIVNQFVQDITGVPVVVLERLSRQEIQEKLCNSSIT